MRWFGTRFDAPVYEEVPSMPTPVGRMCCECGRPIAAEDNGFEIPGYTEDVSHVEQFFMHRKCFFRNIFGDDEGFLLLDHLRRRDA